MFNFYSTKAKEFSNSSSSSNHMKIYSNSNSYNHIIHEDDYDNISFYLNQKDNNDQQQTLNDNNLNYKNNEKIQESFINSKDIPSNNENLNNNIFENVANINETQKKTEFIIQRNDVNNEADGYTAKNTLVDENGN